MTAVRIPAFVELARSGPRLSRSSAVLLRAVAWRNVRTTLPTGVPLIGRVVQLDLLSEADVDELHPLLADPEVYASGYVVHRRPSSAVDGRELARRFLSGQGEADSRGRGRTAYAVRLCADTELGAAGTFVGTSSLLEADLMNERIHLGSTLYGRRWWGTRVNPEAKLLLLRHCFEECGYGRVKIQTDLLNERSQRAISRLGAQREGVLRRHTRREDGTFRDTVVFSVLADEWPTVRAGLEARLS
jgi:RimJ/RimL family protein N-acetyltransferase